MKVKCLTSIYPSKMINESNKYTKLIFTKNINCYTYIFFSLSGNFTIFNIIIIR